MKRLAARGSAALALAACGYAALALARTNAPARDAGAGAPATASPALSVLVPIYGDEPGLEADLRAHCVQSYDDYEVLFGARDPADAGLAVARRVAAEFPHVARAVVATGAALRNPKVSTLAALEPLARGEIIVVADSDVRLAPGDLGGIAAAFADPAVGAASCLYRGAPVDHPVARFGAAGIEEQFVPSVLVACAIEPLRYCLGATMAVRRGVLRRIGGFTAIGMHLADDFALGAAVSATGAKVVLAAPVVATAVTERSIGALWSHERRWARTTLSVRPAGAAGIFLTYPLPLAMMHAAIARSRRSLALVAAAFALRLALGRAARRALRSERPPLSPLLTVARDWFGFAVWASAFAARRVVWRGDVFEVEQCAR